MLMLQVGKKINSIWCSDAKIFTRHLQMKLYTYLLCSYKVQATEQATPTALTTVIATV